MRRALVLIILLVLSACTTISDLKKPIKEQYFVLAQDYVRTEIRGLSDVKWVEGLKSGKYVSVGEDENGIYFKGEAACVLLLANKDADYYLKNGEVSESAKSNIKIFPRPINVGGLWIPKKGVNADPKLFYEIRNATDGTFAGVTGMAIVEATEGSINFLQFGSEKNFVKNLTIIDQ
ncbi:hypothetical protein CD58_05330 [Pseudomonas brassicacearum]|uniref:hypothetical protein n=1 Tax=Pseudomonas brassicacearum TaxID=930166 RepID=UPI00042F1E94|nr:hypothetical protein [Pseudomonas brassicacearum]AHL36844.1 hypothetical protein CD58_05330 [Pseudomonas brassicacearum]